MARKDHAEAPAEVPQLCPFDRHVTFRGGFGEWSTPHEVFSWPPKDVAGSEQSMRAGIGPFIETFRAAKFFQESVGNLPSGYDVLSFVRVSHDWPAETTEMLPRKAFTALPSDVLIGVDACPSMLRETGWYERAIAEAGVRVLAGPMELVMATRRREPFRRALRDNC